MDKLLIIADLEDTCHAIPRGLALAAALGQEPEVVAFTYAPLKRLQVDAAQQKAMRKRLIQERESNVQALIDKHRQQDQKVKLQVVWSKDLAGWVNKRCGEGGYAAVIKSAHRSESLLHKPTDWRLLRECPVPVMLVGEKSWSKTKPVLATLDLSTTVASKRRLNHKVLGNALRLSQALGAELQIISAIEVPTVLADLGLIESVDYVRSAEAEMAQQISKLAASFDLPESIFTCKPGPVEKVVIKRADKIKAQIVVMGTVGRSGVRAALMGNSAERILQNLQTDVWALKP